MSRQCAIDLISPQAQLYASTLAIPNQSRYERESEKSGMGTVDPESLRGFAHVPEPDAPVVTDDFNLGKEAYTYRQQLATVYKSVDHGRA